jgi:hypothetical protein
MKKVKLFEEFINEDDNLEMLKLMNKAMKMMPGSPKQKEVIKQLNVLRTANGLEPLKESVVNEAKVTRKDYDKVVKLLSKSKHPFTIMFVPKWDEIEIIVGRDAPDPIIDDINQMLSKAGLYNNKNISMSGDSSSYSRREYEAIERINGGHKDYYR